MFWTGHGSTYIKRLVFSAPLVKPNNTLYQGCSFLALVAVLQLYVLCSGGAFPGVKVDEHGSGS